MFELLSAFTLSGVSLASAFCYGIASRRHNQIRVRGRGTPPRSSVSPAVKMILTPEETEVRRGGSHGNFCCKAENRILLHMSPSLNYDRSRTSALSPFRILIRSRPMDKFNIRLLYLSLFILILNSRVNSAYQKQNETIRIGVDLVNLDISVTDKHRHPVRNLTSKDFTVLEDGVPQKIESFTPGSVIPATTDQKGKADQKTSEPISSNRKPFDETGRQFSG